jgi:hypothetical protein
MIVTKASAAAAYIDEHNRSALDVAGEETAAVDPMAAATFRRRLLRAVEEPKTSTILSGLRLRRSHEGGDRRSADIDNSQRSPDCGKDPMTIALIGYGKMGKEIERLARERSVTIGAIFDPASHPGIITPRTLKGIDVCIDFSSPASAVENIRAVAAAGKNMVVGTTGWYELRKSAAEPAAPDQLPLANSPSA